MRHLLIVAAAGCLAVSPVSAREFAAYDGPDAVRTGEGGTRVTKHGIDYWTTGTPPRRYRLIGVITDSRYEAWGVKAVGSPSIAKQTKKLGGDAVIILDQREKSDGAYVVGTGSALFGGEDVKTITRLKVIEYID